MFNLKSRDTARKGDTLRARKRESAISAEVLDEPVQGVQTEEDLNAVMRRLSKGLLKRVLEAEMTEHLGHESGGAVVNLKGNVRNGASKKTLKGESIFLF